MVLLCSGLVFAAAFMVSAALLVFSLVWASTVVWLGCVLGVGMVCSCSWVAVVLAAMLCFVGLLGLGSACPVFLIGLWAGCFLVRLLYCLEGFVLGAAAAFCLFFSPPCWFGATVFAAAGLCLPCCGATVCSPAGLRVLLQLYLAAAFVQRLDLLALLLVSALCCYRCCSYAAAAAG